MHVHQQSLQYAKRCRICSNVLPKHVSTFEPLSPLIRYGVEIEILIPNGKADGFDFHLIATQLINLGSPCISTEDGKSSKESSRTPRSKHSDILTKEANTMIKLQYHHQTMNGTGNL